MILHFCDAKIAVEEWRMKRVFRPSERLSPAIYKPEMVIRSVEIFTFHSLIHNARSESRAEAR
jgi:hypothetical protein